MTKKTKKQTLEDMPLDTYTYPERIGTISVLRVPDGWIYNQLVIFGDLETATSVFVPENKPK